MCGTSVDGFRAESGEVFETGALRNILRHSLCIKSGRERGEVFKTGALRNIFRQSSRIKSGREGKKCSKQALCGTFRNALCHIPEVFETRGPRTWCGIVRRKVIASIVLSL